VSALLKGIYKELTGESTERHFRRLLGPEYMEAEGMVPMVATALNGSIPVKAAAVGAVDRSIR
jgi:hypothetical protein